MYSLETIKSMNKVAAREARGKRPYTANYDAVAIAEGFCDRKPTERQQIEAWQHLIDTGLAWHLQGRFGRNAEALIEAGICHQK